MKLFVQLILSFSWVVLVSGCQEDIGKFIEPYLIGQDTPIITHSGGPCIKGLKDPVFKYISPNWCNQPDTVRMDEMWQTNGVNAKGQNYYFFPRPGTLHEYSERFNPQSNYFQCWFGIYTVEDSNNVIYALSNNKIDERAIFDLLIADQNSWLILMGLSQPLAVIDTFVPLNASTIHLGGRLVWKITGTITTNMDIGVNNPQTDMESLLQVPLTAWQGLVESYDPIKLEIVCYVWYACENKELNVVYYNGVEFKDRKGICHRTLPLISAELNLMALNVTVDDRKNRLEQW